MSGRHPADQHHHRASHDGTWEHVRERGGLLSGLEGDDPDHDRFASDADRLETIAAPPFAKACAEELEVGAPERGGDGGLRVGNQLLEVKRASRGARLFVGAITSAVDVGGCWRSPRAIGSAGLARAATS